MRILPVRCLGSVILTRCASVGAAVCLQHPASNTPRNRGEPAARVSKEGVGVAAVMTMSQAGNHTTGCRCMHTKQRTVRLTTSKACPGDVPPGAGAKSLRNGEWHTAQRTGRVYAADRNVSGARHSTPHFVMSTKSRPIHVDGVSLPQP